MKISFFKIPLWMIFTLLLGQGVGIGSSGEEGLMPLSGTSFLEESFSSSLLKKEGTGREGEVSSELQEVSSFWAREKLYQMGFWLWGLQLASFGGFLLTDKNSRAPFQWIGGACGVSKYLFWGGSQYGAGGFKALRSRETLRQGLIPFLGDCLMVALGWVSFEREHQKKHESRLLTLETDLRGKETELGRAQSRLASREKELGELREVFQEKEARLQEENKKLEEAIQNLRDTREEKTGGEDLSFLEEAFEKQEEKLSQLKKERDEKQEEIKKLSKQLEEKDSELERLSGLSKNVESLFGMGKEQEEANQKVEETLKELETLTKNQAEEIKRLRETLGRIYYGFGRDLKCDSKNFPLTIGVSVKKKSGSMRIMRCIDLNNMVRWERAFSYFEKAEEYGSPKALALLADFSYQIASGCFFYGRNTEKVRALRVKEHPKEKEYEKYKEKSYRYYDKSSRYYEKLADNEPNEGKKKEYENFSLKCEEMVSEIGTQLRELTSEKG